MKKNTNNFNLVEIILAMGIIVICITSVLGMFAGGMKISKGAAMRTYSNLVIEQIVGLAESEPTFKDNIPTIETIEDNGIYYPKADADANLLLKPKLNASTLPDGKDGDDIKNEEANTQASSVNMGKNDTLKIYKCNNYDGVFKVTFSSDLTSGQALDFTCTARVWYDKSPVTINTSDGSSSTINSTLRVEISWPPNEHYSNRILKGNFIQFSKAVQP